MPADYQAFDLIDGHVADVGERMQRKLEAIPLPELKGRHVLDVGCDMGFWSFLAADRGAKRVVGLDRNRHVQGAYTDLVALNNSRGVRGCEFHEINVGKQWKPFGQFHVAFVFSMYHHIYANCGDHLSIWYWLRLQMAPRGILIYEGPMDCSDPVPARHIPKDWQDGYNADAILKAADAYFIVEHIGPALHEPNREVYRMVARPLRYRLYEGEIVKGAGGATPAWEHDGGRRICEFAFATGHKVVPGSLNTQLDKPFHWDQSYFRSQILDVAERGKGLDVEWAPRWARIYPVEVCNVPAYAFRFEGETYRDYFVEFVSPARLRYFIDDAVEVLG